MDRNDYVTRLGEIHFEMLGLVGEAITPDGEEVDDRINDRYDKIADALGDLIADLGSPS